MGMKSLMAAGMILSLAACEKPPPPAAPAPPPPPPPAPAQAPAAAEPRPFRKQVTLMGMWGDLDYTSRILKQAKGLESRILARRSDDPKPNFGDLVDELVLKGYWYLVFALLRDESLDALKVVDLVEVVGQRDSPEALAVMLEQLDWGGKDPRREALVRGVGKYQAFPAREPEAFDRLVYLLRFDPDPIIRGTAATWLGDSSRPEVVGILTKALEDHAEIVLNRNEEFELDTVAKRAEKSLKRLPGPGQ